MHFITGEPRFSVHQYSRCEKVANIFAQNYSYMANGSDAPKIEVSFHLLMFAHLGGCLWCEGEGLALSAVGANDGLLLSSYLSLHVFIFFAHLGGCLWCEGEGLSHCA